MIANYDTYALYCEKCDEVFFVDLDVVVRLVNNGRGKAYVSYCPYCGYAADKVRRRDLCRKMKDRRVLLDFKV